MAALEYWLRGPVIGILPELQPAAHALLQAREEVKQALIDFPERALWQKPAGVASVGFHLQHLSGVIDRLFTYANGEQLSPVQMEYLTAEGKEDLKLSADMLFEQFSGQVDKAIVYLKTVSPNLLLQPRGVGRKQLPSNVIGLLFHAAEHTQRHTGQLLVTAQVLKQDLLTR